MVISTKQYTAEEFEAFIESHEGKFELVGGEIMDAGSNAYSSKIAVRVAYLITRFLEDNHLQGHVTGEAGLYRIGDDVYAPDVAYLSVEKQAELDKTGANSAPPELAVEIISPTDKPDDLSLKVVNYLNVGVAVWVFNPDDRTATVYLPGHPGKVVASDETIDGGDILPSFTLSLNDLFTA
jgi:Uma2 family endonuclease